MTTASVHPSLSLITRDADDQLRLIRDVLSQRVMVDGRADVEDVLNNLARDTKTPTPRTPTTNQHTWPSGSIARLYASTSRQKPALSAAECPLPLLFRMARSDATTRIT